jgi:hypothetical protein
VNRFINHLQDVTTNNYNTIAISTLYESLHAKSSAASSVFTRRFLVTASNIGDSSASRAQVLSSQTAYRADLVAPVVFKATPRYGPLREHPVSNSTSIVVRRFVAVGTC